MDTTTDRIECAPGQHRIENGTCTRCPATVTRGPASLAVVADDVPDTYAGRIAVTHRDGLRSAGLACGPVTVVDGEPGFDVLGGEREDVPATTVRVGHLVLHEGAPREVVRIRKGRGQYTGRLWFDIGDVELLVRPSQLVAIRPHRRSFDERGGMAITRR